MTPIEGLAMRLSAALSGQTATSSDYDLNPDVSLPKGRKLRQAAVLVPILVGSGAPRVMLTKRSSHLKHHPGQIAFPGGKVESEDAGPEDAALREASEETALPRNLVRLIGRLPVHETVTGFSVTPIVGIVEQPFGWRAELGEVEEIFAVPFAHLADPSNYRVQSRRWRDRRRHYWTVPFGPYYIWGATARILHGLASGMAR